MRFLEGVEIEKWCENHDLKAGSTPTASPGLHPGGKQTYGTGRRSGEEPAIAHRIIEEVGAWTECLLWVRGWGVWPSSEDWPAYYALRGAQHERRSLDKAPGHLFSSTESALAIEFLSSVLGNAWDAELIVINSDRQASSIAHISHDEWYEIHSTPRV